MCIRDRFIIRHVEEFLKDLIAWEDYDDDQPVANNPIGFTTNFVTEEEG